MRILMTTDTVGGVWTFTKELSEGLLERGCSIALLSLGREPNADQSKWAQEMKWRWTDSFAWKSLDTPLEWMPENDRSYREAAPILLNFVEEFEPDLFHANQFCFGALPISVPRLVTAHSDVLSWADVCHKAPLPASTWLERYYALVSSGINGADAIVAPTSWMLDALRRNFYLPAHTSVIANGRELEPGSYSEHRMLRAITAGRLWDEGKGVEALLNFESCIPLLIAGPYSEQGRLAESTLQPLGELTPSELMELFHTSAIYICTSLYEPFGLAPLEAALCGCAVVARDIPSLREVWEEGALYFEDGVSLAPLLQRLASDQKHLIQAQTRSQRRAKRYTRAAMASSYLRTYKNLLQTEPEFVHVA